MGLGFWAPFEFSISRMDELSFQLQKCLVEFELQILKLQKDGRIVEQNLTQTYLSMFFLFFFAFHILSSFSHFLLQLVRPAKPIQFCIKPGGDDPTNLRQISDAQLGYQQIHGLVFKLLFQNPVTGLLYSVDIGVPNLSSYDFPNSSHLFLPFVSCPGAVHFYDPALAATAFEVWWLPSCAGVAVRVCRCQR